jgi:signal transduction histidine kinase
MRAIALRRSILFRALTSHVALAVLPLMVAGVLAISAVQDGVRDLVADANLEVARRAAGEVSLFVSRARDLAGAVATAAPLVGMEPFLLDNIVNTFVRRNDVLSSLSILDTDGTYLATTVFGEAFVADTTEGFRSAAAGRSYASQVYITDDGLPAMRVAEPIVSLGRVVGVVSAEIDLRAMWDFVDSIRVGETGGTSLVSETGILIASRKRGRVYAQENLGHRPLVVDALRGVSGSRTVESEGGSSIACAAPVPQLGWVVLIEQPEDEAFALGRRLRGQIVIGVAVVLLVSVAVGVVFARRLAKPIAGLVSGVRSLSSGDLSTRMPEPEPDELGALAREFNKMAERLDEHQKRLARMERLAALSRFAGVVAHEVRNPLNSIALNLEVVAGRMRSLAPDDEALSHVRLIKDEVDRLALLVRDFLSYARAPELHKIRADLADVVGGVVELTEGRANGQNVVVRSELVSATTDVDGDRMKQALLNVVDNALYVMPDGGELTIVLRREGGEAVVSVADTGPGFTPDEAGRASDLAYTTKPDGLGIGLSIAQTVVEGHGGKLVLTNREGGGALVVFRLPLSGREER